MTISLSRGRVRSMFFRLWVRAPRIRILSQVASLGGRRKSRSIRANTGWMHTIASEFAVIHEDCAAHGREIPPQSLGLVESPPVNTRFYHERTPPRNHDPTTVKQRVKKTYD